jgi:hypothetical protein
MPADTAARAILVRVAARRVPGNPDGELEALAAALTAVGPQHVPALWRTPSFARRVESARLHLGAARSRAVLADSFEREACRLGPATSGAARRAEAVRVAYALRWIELTRGVDQAVWPHWLDRRFPGIW